jgi:hypothetical protein
MNRADSAVSRGRVEYRPRVRDNLYTLSVLTFIGLFAVAGAILGRAWNSGWWAMPLTVILVLGFSVLPWLYTSSAVIWVDGEQVGYDRLFVLRKTAARATIRRVIGVSGQVRFVGERGVVLSALRFWSDDQLRAMASDLGLKLEGVSRGFGRL